MKRLFVMLLLGGFFALGDVRGGINVLTYHNDLARTGQNTNEPGLAPVNINTNTFGKLYSYPVDGYVYAQPLYMQGVNVTGFGVRNVLFVATEHDSVYAFDADSNGGATTGLLWKVSFIDPDNGVTTVPNDDPQIACADLVPEIGITSTPVIDPATTTLYVVAKTREIAGDVTNFVYRLHALSLADGSEKFGGPVVIQASVPGTGLGTDGFGQVPFDPIRELNRMGLLLNNGLVYFGFSSHCGDGAHGWLFAYNAQTLSFSNAFLSTPNGQQGGIWEGGCAPACDVNGNVYISTGNGDFDGPVNNNYGDSLLKFSKSLQLLDYFAPTNQATLFADDRDLGAGGVVLLPNEVGSVEHPRLMVCAGKKGEVYLVDRDNLGQYDPNSNHVVQAMGDFAIGSSFGPPAYFNKTLYYFGANDLPKAFTITNGFINPTPVSQGLLSYKFPGAGPVVSADGTNNAIVWAVETRGYTTNGPSILHAYDATDLSVELYNSKQASARDEMGAAVKFAVPTITNGRIYVGVQQAVNVFGLFSSVSAPAPAIVPAGGTFTNSVQIALTDSATNAVIYYTLNGVDPTTNSTLYTAPFALTTNATVKAIAVASGFSNSTVTAASFTVVIVPAPTTGFTATPTNGPAFLSVTFTDSSSGVITNRRWNFGDSTIVNTNVTSLTHLYTSAGTFSVSLTVSGPGGTNTLSRPNYITATPAITDTNPPVILSFTSKLQSADGNGQATVPDFASAIQATDNITPSNSLLRTQSPLQGVVVGVGTTIVTLVVSDAAANSSTATTTFVVFDATPPNFTACAPWVTNSASFNCQMLVPDFTTSVQVSDNVTASNNLVKTQSPLAGTVVGSGVTMVTITVKDAANNSATCNTRYVVIDNTLPVINACAGPVTNAANFATGTAPVPDFASIVDAADNCTASVSLTRSQLPVAGTQAHLGTTLVTVTIQDGSGNIATCPANFIVVSTNLPVFTSGPVVTNALLQAGNVAVVAANETNVFNVTAIDPLSQPLSYQWNFGDGVLSAMSTQSLAQHAYVTNCGPYAASVIVSNSYGTVSSNLTVAVACQLDLAKLGAAVNFSKTNSDSASIKANVELGETFVPFTPAGLNVTVGIGGAAVDFVLDEKGRGVNGSSSCRLAYKKPTKTKAQTWQLTVKFSKGTWNDDWADEGFANQTIKNPGMPVVLPVVVIVGQEGFAAEPTLTYTATAGKSGKAK